MHALRKNMEGSGSASCHGGAEVEDGFSVEELPPGFRFHPTDEEIIIHYLIKKVCDRNFAAAAVGEADLNRCEPWDLPKKAKTGEKEWFFFCQRDRKYPTGMRTNRATECGYWKATGKDKEIYSRSTCLVGMKKTLVFYKGRAPRGEKTSWIMHEYRLEGDFSNTAFSRAAKEEWNVCKVFHKIMITGSKLPRIGSFVDHFLDSPMQQLPPLEDYSLSQRRPDSIRVPIDQENIPSYNNHDRKHDMILMISPNYHDHDNMTSLAGSNIQRHSRDPKPNPIFHRDQFITLPNLLSFSDQTPPSLIDDQDRIFPNYPTVFSFENGVDHDQDCKGMIFGKEKLYKMEHNISANNSMISHSHQETDHQLGINEISSAISKGSGAECNTTSDHLLINDQQQLLLDDEGLSLSPGISDLDSLWTY